MWRDSSLHHPAWPVFHCSLGGVVIALAIFALAGMVLRRADWPLTHPWTGGAIVVIGATAYTVWSEWHNGKLWPNRR